MNRKYFFTADTHFGHANIIKYCGRPFLCQSDQEVLDKEGQWHRGDWKGETSSKHRIHPDSVKIMDDTLINNINDIVKENDTLWHLGDWCFAPKYDYYRKSREYRDRIVCKDIRFIWGNHDHYSIRDLFTETYDLIKINVNDQIFVLSHYAMAVWDGSHRYTIQLYGHSHANAEPWLDKVMPGRRSQDVGVDNAAKLLGKYRPFTVEEITKIMNNRSGFFFNHNISKNGPTEEELIVR